jgi:hypothetical protein
VADEIGVSIDNARRSGTCASCRAKLVSGNVTMAVEDALTREDKAGVTYWPASPDSVAT